GKKTTLELVAELEHPNAWRRETAQRLLFERQDQAAAAPLRRQLQGSSSAQGRLHALWSLQGLGALRDTDLQIALRDKSAGVREHAVRLAEPRMAQSAPLLDRVLEMADDA